MAEVDHFDQRSLKLLCRAKDGDRESLEKLLVLTREPLLRRIRLMMGEKARQVADSGDFLHQVLVAILGDFHRFQNRGKGSFLRWATQVARNNIRSEIRKKRERTLGAFSSTFLPKELSGESLDQPPEKVAVNEDLERLVEGIESLKPDYQTVIELRDFDGYTFSEIASMMDRKSESAVRMLYTRALAKLTKILVR